MKKRLFALLLTLCMIVSVFPVGAWAASTASGYCGDELTWEIKDNVLTISGKGDMDSWSNEVTPWADYCSKIVEIQFQGRVTGIGARAFEGFTSLKEVVIPASVSYIESNAFKNCTALKRVEFLGDAPELFIYVFYNVDGATVYYPAGNDTWTEDLMGNYGGELKWVAANGEAEEPETPSNSCGENATWAVKDNVLTISGTGAMTDYGSWKNVPWADYQATVKKVVVEEGITTISSGAFSSFKNLTEIVLPGTLTKLGDQSLNACPKLTSVKIPASVTVIGSMAFMGTGLTEIAIPAGIKSIGDLAFACDNLKKITFLGNAPAMTEGTFSGVTATLYFPADNSTWNFDIMVKDYTGGSGELTWIAYCSNGHSYVDGICKICGAGTVSAPEITADNVSSTGKIRLKWAKVEGAAQYEVYRATSQTGTYKLMYRTTGTSYVNSSATRGNTYYYYVKAVGADGVASSASNVASATYVLGKPSVTVSNAESTGKPKLTWEKVDGAVKYQVYRSTTKDGEYTLAKTTTGTSYTNTKAVSGYTYYYKVLAIAENTAANTWSSIKSRTCDLPMPEITATNDPETGKIVLSWELNVEAKEYGIYRSTSGKSGTYSKIGTVFDDEFVDTTAKAGKYYYYKVRAVSGNSAANSAYDSVSRTCDCATPKVSVTLNSKGKPRLTWKAVEGAKEYQVYRSTSGKSGSYKKVFTTTGTSYTNSKAEQSVTYYYKVRAVGTKSAANSDYASVFINCSISDLSSAHSAKLLILEINKYRKGYGLEELTWVEGALDAAKIRVIELKAHPYVERPNGVPVDGLLEDYGMLLELDMRTEPNTTETELADLIMGDEDYEELFLLEELTCAVAAMSGEYWVIMLA